MDSAGYKIILSLSHHRISFEYWQRDAEATLRPLPPGNWPARLAFYASPSGIKIGEEAARAAHAGILNAFDNYFERSVQDDTYTIAGQCRPIRNILLDAAESVFSDFYRSVLINRLGQLNDNRASMPLTIVCEADIKPNERSFLKGLFSDSGYAKVNVENYDILIGRYIRDFLSKEFDFENIVVAWTEGTDLTYTLYRRNEEKPVDSVSLPGLGVDPRKEYVSNIIWDRMLSQNPWLSRDMESDRIEKVATDFLNSNLPLVSGKLMLSDGNEYAYSLNRQEIDFIPRNEGVRIKEELLNFLLKNGITDRSKTMLLLRGVAAGNPYFETNLSLGFVRTIKSDKKLRNNTMHQLIAQGNVKGESVTPPPLIPEIPVVESAPESVETSSSGAAVTPPKQEGKVAEKENPEVLKRLKKQWREVKAAAKGKERTGNAEEGCRILDDFLREISSVAGATDLCAEVEALRKEIAPVAPASRSSVRQTPPPVPPRVTERPRRSPSPSAAPASVSEGDSLISQGKLKEARDWYRAEGNSTKARILSDILRARKGVEIRKSTIEECRRSRDRQQIERIARELEDYINDCDKAKVPCADIKLLLNEYKKIK